MALLLTLSLQKKVLPKSKAGFYCLKA